MGVPFYLVLTHYGINNTRTNAVHSVNRYPYSECCVGLPSGECTQLPDNSASVCTHKFLVLALSLFSSKYDNTNKYRISLNRSPGVYFFPGVFQQASIQDRHLFKRGVYSYLASPATTLQIFYQIFSDLKQLKRFSLQCSEPF